MLVLRFKIEELLVNTESNTMLNTFIKASVNNAVIHIKVDNGIILPLFDILHDNHYRVEVLSPEEWDYHIEDGTSYEIDTIEELIEFKGTNVKYKELKNETQS